MFSRLSRYTDLGLLIIRLGLGLGFLYYHGWGKITGGPERWESLGGAMEIFGITFWPVFWGFMISFAESIGAVLIAIGFLFRPMSAILAFGMFVAWLRHEVTGNGNPGHAWKNMTVLIGLVLVGPGKYSVDAWLHDRKNVESGM